MAFDFGGRLSGKTAAFGAADPGSSPGPRANLSLSSEYFARELVTVLQAQGATVEAFFAEKGPHGFHLGGSVQGAFGVEYDFAENKMFVGRLLVSPTNISRRLIERAPRRRTRVA